MIKYTVPSGKNKAHWNYGLDIKRAFTKQKSARLQRADNEII
jgi:hypothetical protein